ncbi:MAG: protein O-mannosyl-transferase family [Anaerolineae bacterium]
MVADKATPLRRKQPPIDLVLSLLAAAGCLSLYLRTLAPSILGGDAGEMQFVPHVLSLAHPTGYPLQTLLGRLWTATFRLGPVAYRMNALSAVAAAAAVGLLYGTARLLYASRPAALLAALLVGVSPLFWDQAIIADKYALNACLLALLLFIVAWWSRAPAERSFAVCALAGGLCLAHHRSAAVLIPALLAYGLWLDGRLTTNGRYIGLVLLHLVAPLVLYAWLPIGAARNLPPGTWQPQDLSGWLAYLLDRGYVGAVRPQVDLLGKLAYSARVLVGQFTPAGIVLAFLGLVRQALAGRRWLPFLAVGFALQALLSAAYEVPRHWVFFLPSYLFVGLWIADGLDWLASEVVQLHRRRRVLGIVCSALFGAVGLLLLAMAIRASYPELRVAHRDGGVLDLWRQDLKVGYRAERFATSALAAVAPEAIIVCDWEQATPLWYLQQVEGQRPDVSIVYPFSRLTDALATGRPTYVSRNMPIEGPYHLSCAGPLVHVSPSAANAPPPDSCYLSVQWEDQLELVAYRIGRDDFRSGYVLPLTLYFRAHRTPAADYSLSLRLYEEQGIQVWAEDRDRFALGMYPTSRWAAGEVVAEYREVPFPRELPAGRYRIGLIIYSMQDGAPLNLQLLGSPDDIAYLPELTIAPRP